MTTHPYPPDIMDTARRVCRLFLSLCRSEPARDHVYVSSVGSYHDTAYVRTHLHLDLDARRILFPYSDEHVYSEATRGGWWPNNYTKALGRCLCRVLFAEEGVMCDVDPDVRPDRSDQNDPVLWISIEAVDNYNCPEQRSIMHNLWTEAEQHERFVARITATRLSPLLSSHLAYQSSSPIATSSCRTVTLHGETPPFCHRERFRQLVTEFLNDGTREQENRAGLVRVSVIDINPLGTPSALQEIKRVPVEVTSNIIGVVALMFAPLVASWLAVEYVRTRWTLHETAYTLLSETHSELCFERNRK